MHPSFKQTLLVVAISTFSFSCIAEAQQPTTPVDQVVVTANPIIDSNRIDNFSTYATTITQSQIKELNALELPDALRMTPGVQISLYDAVGSYSGNQGGSVYIHGLGTSRPGSEIKTYVDGVPVYMGLWNHPLMDALPLNGMQSINILKSPQPQNFGNNFAAIDLQTKKPVTDGIAGDINASIGSYSTRVLQGNLLARSNRVDFMLAAGSADSDGYRDNGDAKLRNALGKIGFAIDDIWSVGASVLYVRNRVGDPGDERYSTTIAPVGPYQSNGVARNISEMTMWTAFLAHDASTSSGELRLYQNEGKNNLENDASWGTFESNFKLYGLRWREQFTPWQGAQISGGVDHDSITGDITGPFVGAAVGTPFAFGPEGSADIPTFRLLSPYVGMSQQFALSREWSVQPSVGVRYYDSNIYASKTAPNAGISFSRTDLTIYGNYSLGIQYPGAETYALTRALPLSFMADNGWDTLKPQQDKHTELGIKWSATRSTHIDANIFRDRISDRYTWDGFSVFATGDWSNDDDAYQIKGGEISVHQNIGSLWSVFAGLTKLSASDNDIPYVPKTAVSFGTTSTIGVLRMTLDAQYQSKMNSPTFDRGVTNYAPAVVDSFTVANVRLAYPMAILGETGEIYTSVNNLFDEDYAYNVGYPMPGRNYRVGVIASFK